MNYRLVFNKISKKFDVFNVTSRRLVKSFTSEIRAKAYIEIISRVGGLR